VRKRQAIATRQASGGSYGRSVRADGQVLPPLCNACLPEFKVLEAARKLLQRIV
jgi:hypothetical protein